MSNYIHTFNIRSTESIGLVLTCPRTDLDISPSVTSSVDEVREDIRNRGMKLVLTS